MFVTHDPADRLRRAWDNDDVMRRIWWFWWWSPIWFLAVMLGEWDDDLYADDCASDGTLGVAGRSQRCCPGGPQWGHDWDCPKLP